MKPAAAWWDAMSLLHGMRDEDMAQKKDPRLFKEMDATEERERALFTAIATACGYDLSRITKGARGRINQVIHGLMKVDATPKEVAIVANGMLCAWKSTGVINPQAIENNWPKFVGGTDADKRIAIERKIQDATDRLKQKQVRAALALSHSDFDKARNRVLEIDHGLMRKYLLEEPARENLYLLERIGKLLDEGETRFPSWDVTDDDSRALGEFTA